MQHMIVNKELKQFRETTENRNAFITACRSMIASFKYGHNSRFLAYSKEILLSGLNLNICLRIEIKTTEQPFMTNPGIS
jgi:hypothetical protein